MIALLFASALVGAPDAFATLKLAVDTAQHLPSNNVLRTVQGSYHEPLVNADVQDALPAADRMEEALGAVDAANAQATCVVPAEDVARADVVPLVDGLLMLASVEGASGKPSTAAAHLSRAADVARLMVRCEGVTVASMGFALELLAKIRTHTAGLMRAQWLDVKAATRAATALAPPSDAELARLTVAKADVLTALRVQLMDARGQTQALVNSAQQAPTAIEQGGQIKAQDVDVRCGVTMSPTRFVVSRPVMAVLADRGAQAIMADSELFFALDGTGLMVLRAGPAARSCGLRDGDVVVDVNGKRPTAQDALALSDNIIKDGKANIRARRASDYLDIVIEPAP